MHSGGSIVFVLSNEMHYSYCMMYTYGFYWPYSAQIHRPTNPQNTYPGRYADKLVMGF
jgi:hypothetical protein